MKKNLFFTVLIIFLSISAFSQTTNDIKKEVKLNYFDVSSGRSSLGSGVYFITGFSKGSSNFQITLATEERIFINSFFKIKSTGLKGGPSIGYFKNVPFTGAIASFNPFGQKIFSTFHWIGYSFGQPNGAIAINPSFLFSVNAANVDIWRFRCAYSIVNYQDLKAKHVVFLKYSQKLSETFSAYTDLGYDFTNKTQLLKVGINLKMK